MIYIQKKKTQKTKWNQRLRAWKEQVSREQHLQEQISQHLHNVFSGKRPYRENQEN